MARVTPSTSNSLSGFTDPLSHSPFEYSSGFFSESHRFTRGEIARRERIAQNGRTRTPSTTSNFSDLLEGSTAEDEDQNHFDPTLGPIGSGRPKSSVAPEDSYDQGINFATCIKLYRLSPASSEQEPPITTTVDCSDSAASTNRRVHFDLGTQLVAPSARQAEVRARTRELCRKEALPAIVMRWRLAEELGGDNEVVRGTNEYTLINILDGIRTRVKD